MPKGHYVIPVFVPDLGCPHRCVFCNQARITGQAVIPDAVAVQQKLADFLPHIPKGEGITVEVAFYGGSFTAIAADLQKELLTPALIALNRGQIDHIRISTRPDAIDEEALTNLSSFGVSIIELGVQSMDNMVLNQANRGHNSRDVLRAVALIKSWGFTLGLQMMIGLPGDTGVKAGITGEEIIALHPDFVRIYPCLVLKGTLLAQMYEQGDYQPWSLEDAVQVCKSLLIKYEKAQIPVIRIGLQPSEEISWAGDVLAGPYHPAFRELVEAAVAREQMRQLLAKVRNIVGQVNQAAFLVPAADLSIARGQKNSNVNYFKHELGMHSFVISPYDYNERGMVLLVQANRREFNLVSTRKTMD